MKIENGCKNSLLKIVYTIKNLFDRLLKILIFYILIVG